MIEMLAHFDFVYRALAAGLAIAVLAGPIGSLMVWRRMSYFGDTLAHSTLLGLSLSVLLQFNLYFGLITVSILIALLLSLLNRVAWLANDTILGILSHSTLATGLLVATSISGVRIDLLSYLYGDILAVQPQDLVIIYSMSASVLLVIWRLWDKLLAITVAPDLAKTEGINVAGTNAIFALLLAIVFALSIKLVGVLLISAMLIIPAATARKLAKTPEQMAAFASIIAVLALGGGMLASIYIDIPTGPAVVVAAALMFICSLLLN